MARRKNKLGPTNVNIKHVSEETAKKQKLENAIKLAQEKLAKLQAKLA